MNTFIYCHALFISFSHGLNIGFFILSSYPLINYLEYPLLLSQNLLLLLLTGSINRNLKSSVLQSFAIILFISCIGGGFLPMSIVLGALVSKISSNFQIVEVFYFNPKSVLEMLDWTSSGPGWTASGPTSNFFFEI